MIKLHIKDEPQLQFLPADIFTRWREFIYKTHPIDYISYGVNRQTYYDNNFNPAFTCIEGEFIDVVDFIKDIDEEIIDVYYTTINDCQMQIPRDIRKQYYICYDEDFELSVFMDGESIEYSF